MREVGGLIEDAQRRLADHHDQIARKRVSGELEDRATRIEAAAVYLDDAAEVFATARAALVEAMRADAMPVTQLGIGLTADAMTSRMVRAALHRASPVDMPISEAAAALTGAKAPTCAVEAARERQVDPLRTLADLIRKGEADPVDPGSFTAEAAAPPRAAAVPEMQIVLSESIVWRSEQGRDVLANEGGVMVPVPVAEAALAGAYGHRPDTAAAKLITTALASGGTYKSDVVRRGPPYRDTGIDLGAIPIDTAVDPVHPIDHSSKEAA